MTSASPNPRGDSSLSSGGHPVDDDRRSTESGARAQTPDDVVPRLVALGITLDNAERFAEFFPRQRIVDALDALEELDADRRVLDPIGWVDAAVKQRWDLSGVLAERREREQRLAAVDAERRARDAADRAFPAWQRIADRWDAAISLALDDAQLSRALELVAQPVAAIGRWSVPVARAALITWAMDVHQRDPQLPLADALADDLDGGPGPFVPSGWPLPEPPADPPDPGEVQPLAARIRAALDTEVAVGRDREPVLEVAVPQRSIDCDQGMDR